MAEETVHPLPPELIESTRKKLDAEAAKAQAEADKAKAEARKFNAEAQTAEAAAAKSIIEQLKAEYEEEKRVKDDDFYRVYRFNSAVEGTSVKACMKQLSLWSRLDPNCHMTVVFTSPGGSVIDGFALWDHIKSLQANGHKFTTVSQGLAASMAGILLQAGDERVMGAESWLMIHEASFGAQGSMGEVKDTVEWVEKVQDRILSIFASRSKMTKTQIKNKWNRKNWWLSSTEALKLGFIDRVGLE
jgi:ATP-dependent Clp endopeptidase proteolytic subunit ClpP